MAFEAVTFLLACLFTSNKPTIKTIDIIRCAGTCVDVYVRDSKMRKKGKRIWPSKESNPRNPTRLFKYVLR
ncbi:hypothetical protein F4808DRAFT_441136 [Astrocystis sublimbata]|nr:hypothetical protein F4808DRAFT_441136 [Astrocystis sublimbata]